MNGTSRGGKRMISGSRRRGAQAAFEFEDVPYIDFTGLDFLAGSGELAAEAGATIVLSDMNPHDRRILASSCRDLSSSWTTRPGQPDSN